MSAPAGLCESCGMPMQWCFIHGELVVRCDGCIDLFPVDSSYGTEVAGGNREGREAVMPDGRPVRSLSLIAKDRAECISLDGGFLDGPTTPVTPGPHPKT